MKVRVGYGLGNLRPLDGDAARRARRRPRAPRLRLAVAVGAHQRARARPGARARRSRRRARSKIKLGTSVQVLPGPQPGAARQGVGDARRALGRPGAARVRARHRRTRSSSRRSASSASDRASIFDEALPLLRRLWTEDAVDHDGARFHYEGMTVLPKPAQQPLDVWLGGRAPGELRRVGRLADGWLASFSTPAMRGRAAA